MKEIPAWLVKAIASGERIAAIHHPDTKVPDALVYSGVEFLIERYMPLGQIAFARIADLSIQPVTNWPMQTAQEMLDTLNRGIAEVHEQTLQPFVPRTPLQFHQGQVQEDVKRVQENIMRAWELRKLDAAKLWEPWDDRTPLQRLQQFAADTGVPVSFEIAERAMKGGE